MRSLKALTAIKTIIATVLVLILLAAIGLYLLLRASLPLLEGDARAEGLNHPVLIARDANGMAVFTAKDRIDLAMATGYVHAQERYFQMDLLRRNAAAELAFLFGPAALERDREIALHKFRERARQRIETLPSHHLAILQAYSKGVNQGIEALSAKPFEYYLLQAELQPWKEEDTLLALYSMYLDLQYHDGRRDLSLDLMKRHLAGDLYDFLHPDGSRWDAPIDDTPQSPPAMAQSSWPQAPAQSQQKPDGEAADLKPGSNNWAVSGALTPYRAAMLANDMHLGIRVPNIWYRVQFNWPHQGEMRQLTGLSLPGTPLVVVGSNTQLAWGFTNSYGDWSDVIRLQLDDSKERYLTADGYQPFTYTSRKIAVKGQASEQLTIRETRWGPVIGEDEAGNPLVYRWVAHDPEGANLNLLALETARSVEQGAAIAATAGIPAQNIMLADREGNIGWTIAGPMPIRFGFDGRYISDWSDGTQGWAGYRMSSDYPKVINPSSQRLWTANARVIGGKDYAKIGDGGYALGARSQQIRDSLFAQSTFTEQDFLAIQMDDRAVFLTRWRDLLLEHLENDSRHPDAKHIASLMQNWSGRADTNSLAYLLVRQYRLAIRDRVYQDLLRFMQHKHAQFSYRAIRNQLEIPLWQMVTDKPAHLLPEGIASWPQLFEVALQDTLKGLNESHVNWQRLTWGEYNQVQIRHPMSPFVPLLGWLTDMPEAPLSGDSFMPNVARNAFGASQRLVVAPGQEQQAILHMPSSQSGHPLAPYFGKGHKAWRLGEPTPLLPGKIAYRLKLTP
ncbi:penicillin acylase family protein [Lacimicrobium sp. SS2-24]|uniref:penicillin acylase family protein n=1 Tax=Lacimicrobium sp. SS2-24 TaxID=2005569 RepID=UPI000B4A9199|nr:penicillin acylase family protein [Lacimicrobium sp. SS2-24]